MIAETSKGGVALRCYALAPTKKFVCSVGASVLAWHRGIAFSQVLAPRVVQTYVVPAPQLHPDYPLVFILQVLQFSQSEMVSILNWSSRNRGISVGIDIENLKMIQIEMRFEIDMEAFVYF